MREDNDDNMAKKKIDIKTVKDKTIKTADNTIKVTDKVRNLNVKVKDISKEDNSNSQGSAEQYAVGTVQGTAKSATGATAKGVEKGSIKTKETIEEVQARRAERKKEQQNKETSDGFNGYKSSTSYYEEAYREQKEKDEKNKGKNNGEGGNNGNNGNKEGRSDTSRQNGNDIRTRDENSSKSGNDPKANGNTLRTTERQASAKAASEMNDQNVSKATERAYQAAEYTREAAETAAEKTKEAAKKVGEAVKKAGQALGSMTTAVVAGGSTAVIVIIILCLVAAVACSVYGIFYTNDSGDITTQSLIQELNNEYEEKIQDILDGDDYDSVEIKGEQAEWKDVLSVYAVKVVGDEDDPKEIATFDEVKEKTLRNIFWDMNEISSKVKVKTEEEETVTTDDDGNEAVIVEKIETKELTITVKSKTAIEMADYYSFSKTQREYLDELMDGKNDDLWETLIGT